MTRAAMKASLAVAAAALLLGVMPVRAQIDDISRQMGVNTTSALSPGNDRTNIHRGFDPNGGRSPTVTRAEADSIKAEINQGLLKTDKNNVATKPKPATHKPATTTEKPPAKKGVMDEQERLRTLLRTEATEPTGAGLPSPTPRPLPSPTRRERKVIRSTEPSGLPLRSLNDEP